MNTATMVSSIMTQGLIFAKTNNAFSETLKLFLSKNIHHLPILNDDDDLIGIISAYDVMNALSNMMYRSEKIDIDNVDKKIKIEDIMTPNPMVISSEDSIKNAAIIFATNKFQALPVVDDKGKLQGILTVRDIVKEVAVNG